MKNKNEVCQERMGSGCFAGTNCSYDPFETKEKGSFIKIKCGFSAILPGNSNRELLSWRQGYHHSIRMKRIFKPWTVQGQIEGYKSLMCE